MPKVNNKYIQFTVPKEPGLLEGVTCKGAGEVQAFKILSNIGKQIASKIEDLKYRLFHKASTEKGIKSMRKEAEKVMNVINKSVGSLNTEDLKILKIRIDEVRDGILILDESAIPKKEGFSQLSNAVMMLSEKLKECENMMKKDKATARTGMSVSELQAEADKASKEPQAKKVKVGPEVQTGLLGLEKAVKGQLKPLGELNQVRRPGIKTNRHPQKKPAFTPYKAAKSEINLEKVVVSRVELPALTETEINKLSPQEVRSHIRERLLHICNKAATPDEGVGGFDFSKLLSAQENKSVKLVLNLCKNVEKFNKLDEKDISYIAKKVLKMIGKGYKKSPLAPSRTEERYFKELKILINK